MVREAAIPPIPVEASLPEADGALPRAQLRRKLLDARSQVSPALRARQTAALGPRLDDVVTERLGSLEDRVLGVYWPIRGEPDLSKLWVDWRGRGAILALPVVDAAAMPLRFVRWAPEDSLIKGPHGVPVPQHGLTVSPELLVIPCVGFDARGYRLGYGGGYYDRTLALAQPATVGVAWGEALLPSFEPEATDRPLQTIVTPEGVWDLLRQQGASPV